MRQVWPFCPLPANAADIAQRVVSINVCTDQLAMLLAREGQLQSVSYLSRDPQLSVMADKAERLPINHAQAEEVFLQSRTSCLQAHFPRARQSDCCAGSA